MATQTPGPPVAAPATRDPERTRSEILAVAAAIGKLDRLLPHMPDPRLASSYAGCYDVTPDYNPIIGPSPAPGLFLLVGQSFNLYWGYLTSPTWMLACGSSMSTRLAASRIERPTGAVITPI